MAHEKVYGYTSPSYGLTIRIEINNRVGMFGRVATAIGRAGGDLGSVDIVGVEKGRIIRDVTVNARDEAHEAEIVQAIDRVRGVRVVRVMDQTFSVHQGGKIAIVSRTPLRDLADLARTYTPGVARVCRLIARNPVEAYHYTIKGNAVAIVTDGSAVLGLGNIGPEPAMAVMEGKAMIFKEFAGIDAYPFALATQDPDEIVRTVENIAPAFGGIHLEDIAAPRCFDVENRLRQCLDIPVFHDDQHGTAVVVLAALINVGRLLRRDIRRFRVAIAGAGAAGTAIARMLVGYGIDRVVVCDRAGAIFKGRRKHMNPHKKALAAVTNPDGIRGPLSAAMEGADVFIGVSGPGLLHGDDIRRMAADPIVFALANPDPEIDPEEALPLAKVLATGRSDLPNQVNNMLSFPGIFRGLLDVQARGVVDDVNVAAARAIAEHIPGDELHEDYILPSVFDKTVTHHVAQAVADAAQKAGLTSGTGQACPVVR